MSPKLPIISGKDCVVYYALSVMKLSGKGFHMRLKDRSGKRSPVTVPDHKLRPGLLKKIIKNAGLTVEEFETLRKT